MDAKTIVNVIHSSHIDESEFGIAIQDCCFLCQRGVQFSICFVRRQAFALLVDKPIKLLMH